MPRLTTTLRFALIAALLASAAAPAWAGCAVDRIKAFDNGTRSGLFEAEVFVYKPLDGKGEYGTPQRYPVQVLFERPDRFRMVLRPGEKAEFLAVSQAGKVQWVDRATGLSGSDAAEKVVEPLALALLGSVGDLSRYAGMTELPVDAKSPLCGAVVRADSGSVKTVTAWFTRKGEPAAFEFHMTDSGRVFLAIQGWKPDPDTDSDDFKL